MKNVLLKNAHMLVCKDVLLEKKALLKERTEPSYVWNIAWRKEHPSLGAWNKVFCNFPPCEQYTQIDVILLWTL